jgi:hypothetical protein
MSQKIDTDRKLQLEAQKLINTVDEFMSSIKENEAIRKMESLSNKKETGGLGMGQHHSGTKDRVSCGEDERGSDRGAKGRDSAGGARNSNRQPNGVRAGVGPGGLGQIYDNNIYNLRENPYGVNLGATG